MGARVQTLMLSEGKFFCTNFVKTSLMIITGLGGELKNSKFSFRSRTYAGQVDSYLNYCCVCVCVCVVLKFFTQAVCQNPKICKDKLSLCHLI